MIQGDLFKEAGIASFAPRPSKPDTAMLLAMSDDHRQGGTHSKQIAPEDPRAPLVSRWAGDGPHAFKPGPQYADGIPRAAFHDGRGLVEMPVYPCSCGQHHPVDFNWSLRIYTLRSVDCGGTPASDPRPAHKRDPHDHPPSDAMRQHRQEQSEAARAEEYAVAIEEAEAEHTREELDDFAEDESDFVQQPAPGEMPRDELGERIVAAGLAPNSYLLQINRSLQAEELPGQWAIPSRLFQFPIVTEEPRIDHRGEYVPRKVSMRHPLLKDHPFVAKVEAALGIELADECDQLQQYDARGSGQWWHAVDLISGNVDALLETAHFTTPHFMAQAVSHAMHYSGSITPQDARRVLVAAGFSDQPTPAIIREVFNEPREVATGEKSKGWPPQQRWEKGHRAAPELIAWAYVLGVELGHIGFDRSGFARWTEQGRAWFAGEAAATLL